MVTPYKREGNQKAFHWNPRRKPQKHKAQIINDIYTTAKNGSFACKRPLAHVFSILRAAVVNYFDIIISILAPIVAKSRKTHMGSGRPAVRHREIIMSNSG